MPWWQEEAKISPNSVRSRTIRVAAKISRLLEVYARAPKYGIKPEQVDWSDLISRLREMETSLNDLPK